MGVAAEASIVGVLGAAYAFYLAQYFYLGRFARFGPFVNMWHVGNEARREWVRLMMRDPKEGINATQSLRNGMLSASLLATVCSQIASRMLAMVANPETMRELNSLAKSDPIANGESLASPQLKLAMGLGLLLMSILCMAQHVRLTMHLMYLIRTLAPREGSEGGAGGGGGGKMGPRARRGGGSGRGAGKGGGGEDSQAIGPGSGTLASDSCTPPTTAMATTMTTTAARAPDEEASAERDAPPTRPLLSSAAGPPPAEAPPEGTEKPRLGADATVSPPSPSARENGKDPSVSPPAFAAAAPALAATGRSLPSPSASPRAPRRRRSHRVFQRSMRRSSASSPSRLPLQFRRAPRALVDVLFRRASRAFALGLRLLALFVPVALWTMGITAALITSVVELFILFQMDLVPASTLSVVEEPPEGSVVVRDVAAEDEEEGEWRHLRGRAGSDGEQDAERNGAQEREKV